MSYFKLSVCLLRDAENGIILTKQLAILSAVQPRRDFIGGKWAKMHPRSPAQLRSSLQSLPQSDAGAFLPSESMELHSTDVDAIERKVSLEKSIIKQKRDCSILDRLLKEEAKLNDRRRILYSQLPIIVILDSGGEYVSMECRINHNFQFNTSSLLAVR